MRASRALLALLLITACAALASRVVIPRMRCNLEKAQVNATTKILDSGDAYARSIRSRRNVEICRRCLALYPNDYEFHMLLATNEYWLGEHARAEESYRRALALNERPEIYAYLAVTQLRTGKYDEARKNLVRASLFQMALIDLVSPPLQIEVHDEVMERHRRLGAKPR